MYTQCPKCQTVFRITMDQLRVHNGLVRCGQCEQVFNADQQLFDEVPTAEPAPKPAAKKRAGKARPATERSARRPAKKTPVRAPAESEVVEIAAAPAPGWTPPEPEAHAPVPSVRAETRSPTNLAEDATIRQLLKRRRRRTASAWWIVAAISLLLTLAAQVAYFYRHPLAAHDAARPWLLRACAQLGCTVRVPSEVARIELIQPTHIAPHPAYESMLRLRATMVNRAARAQSYPLMEVTLTDNLGRVLARRTFAAREYLEQPAGSDSGMPPHVAIGARLDITNPDNKASGYEINFVAPPP